MAAYCEPILCRLDIECVVDLSNLMPAEVPPNKKSICPCTCDQETVHQRSKYVLKVDGIIF